jgi:toxin ParE1/3/4
MTYRIIITDRAWQDIDRRVAWLVDHAQAIDIGLRFLDAVETTTASLTQAPQRRPLSIHRVRDADPLRHVKIVGFPNDLLFYEIGTTAVHVLRHFHGAMNIRQQLQKDQPGPT